mmetsp:Transcript_19934/g.62490  ORF Transcript_19934/g.62490 Transcript_19934/m.62490 type:complete len:294 (+) Transcript_19934:431-1312(+)
MDLRWGGQTPFHVRPGVRSKQAQSGGRTKFATTRNTASVWLNWAKPKVIARRIDRSAKAVSQSFLPVGLTSSTRSGWPAARVGFDGVAGFAGAAAGSGAFDAVLFMRALDEICAASCSCASHSRISRVARESRRDGAPKWSCAIARRKQTRRGARPTHERSETALAGRRRDDELGPGSAGASGSSRVPPVIGRDFDDGRRDARALGGSESSREAVPLQPALVSAVGIGRPGRGDAQESDFWPSRTDAVTRPGTDGSSRAARAKTPDSLGARLQRWRAGGGVRRGTRSAARPDA